MTAVFILSCMLWVKGDYLTPLTVPVSEYGMAEIKYEKSGFLFQADIIEEKMNSVQIRHIAKDVSVFATSTQYPQQNLYTKIQVGEQEASLDCEIKRKPEQ